MTAPYMCRNDHVGQRAADGACAQCRADAEQRHRDSLRPMRKRELPRLDFEQLTAVRYRDEPKSLAEADARKERSEQRRAAREAARKRTDA